MDNRTIQRLAFPAFPAFPAFRAAAALVVTAAAACGGGKARAPGTETAAKAIGEAPASAPVDLSKLNSNIPAARPDTFTFRPLRVERIPDAPPPLMDAAEREQGISRFCYQEYGQKADPRLIGAVALVVTMEADTVRSIRVGADDWSSSAGRAVNQCLVQKAPQAWKLLPGARVPNGRYVVQLQFRPE
ncbi:MAG: hypothetical protein U9Q74_01245 [Gemmatimonadota bacterium]|nr:hypothetical protein [Gemmatimonadota bacterium]